MKAPFYKLTSRCRLDTCCGTFTTDRKKVQHVSTDGRLYTTTRQVCPVCGCWGQVEKIEEIRS